MPAAARARGAFGSSGIARSSGSGRGRGCRRAARALPAAALVVGQLALGIGLVFVRSLAPQLDDRAVDRVSLQPVECATHLFEFDLLVVAQQCHLARRVRLERSFELELIC